MFFLKHVGLTFFQKELGEVKIFDLHKVEQKRRAEREDSVGKWNDLLESSEAELYVTWSKYTIKSQIISYIHSETALQTYSEVKSKSYKNYTIT